MPRFDDLINPLATRYVAPGKMPWIAKGTVELSQLVARFSTLRRAQIVGVHGSGKSTLLEHLVPNLGKVVLRRDASWQLQPDQLNQSVPSTDPTAVCWFSVRRGADVLKSLMQFTSVDRFVGLLVIDGVEQLSWWQRWRIKRWVLSRDCKLLVTAHRDVGWPLLYETRVSEDLARNVIRQAFLLARGTSELPETLDRLPWKQLLENHRGNLRECLMEVYDLVETLNREAK